MTPSSSDALSIARLLQLPAAERSAYLQRACAENPAVRDRLHELEQSFAVTSRDQPAAAAALPPRAAIRLLESALEAHEPDRPGVRVGPFRLLQKIGESGFGVVWLAEQQELMHRRVMLKIVKVGLEGTDVTAHFETERLVLALMDHPNIVRILEAGETPAGRPYFATELVRGLRITRHCDEHRLSVGERVRLFIGVCHAVQHAHEKGIIHRDLKPAGIVVALHDGAAVPRITDFGLASATGAQLHHPAFRSIHDVVVGTSAYASPEQGGHDNPEIDTRSDIFSLGMLLHELLTGGLPDDPAAGGWPSRRLRRLSEAARATEAKLRGTSPRRLARSLEGDLDLIVARCLQGDPARRYETAAALAQDLRSYLADHPVRAHPPSSAYRLQKFLNRHPTALAVAALAGAALLAGLVATFRA